MNIREYKFEDFKKIIDVMCNAFYDDNLYAYFIENESERIEFLKKFMKFRLKYGLKKGKVFVTDDLNGVIIIIKPGEKMTPVDLILCGGLTAILSCNKVSRGKIVDFNSFADNQAKENISKAHWHISPICVSKETQGKGYGSALLKYALINVSSESPFYLETQNLQNISFYTNNEFKLISKSKLPNCEIVNYSMVFQST